MKKRFEETDIIMNNFVVFYDKETKTLRHLSEKAVIDFLNEQEQKIKKYEEIMKKHNIVGVAKLDACLTDYLNVNEDTMAGKIINQLKEEIKQLKFDCAMYKSANYLINDIGIDKAREIMFQTEKKLKQSQNSKAIEELRKVLYQIKNKLDTTKDKTFAQFDFMTFKPIIDYIDNQIKELGGEKNE